MTIEEALDSHLKSDSGVSTLVGARVYGLKLPASPTLPAVSYRKMERTGHRALGGGGNPRYIEAKFQISGWGSSYDDAKDVAKAIQASLQGYTGTMGGAGGVEVLDTSVVKEEDVNDPDYTDFQVAVEAVIYHL